MVIMSAFDQEIDQLSKQLGMEGPGCFPTMIIVAIAIPIVLWLLLYFVSPSFVQVKDGSSFVRSNKKVVMWTFGLSVVLWLGLWLFTYCQGYQSHQLCLF